MANGTTPSSPNMLNHFIRGRTLRSRAPGTRGSRPCASPPVDAVVVRGRRDEIAAIRFHELLWREQELFDTKPKYVLKSFSKRGRL